MNRCRGFIFVTFAFAATAFSEKETVHQADTARLEKLPVNFIENRGQWDRSTKFVARKGNWAAALEKKAIAICAGVGQSPSVRLVFEGASHKVRLAGEGKREGRYNFFIGNDPAKWQADIPAFRSVLYRGVYRGVDVRVREEAGRLEYDLLLAPNADLKKVVVRAEGATGLELADDGALLIKSGNDTLRQPSPQTWEVLADGSTRPVECRFRKIDKQRYGFVTPKRDTRLAMMVDPGLEWSTFLGGGGTESVTGMKLARDGSGDVILSGQTDSADFPHTNGNHAPVGQTPYVARLNAAGSALVYCTFFGGTFNHSVKDLALDPQSQPIIVGDTNSLDFPTTPGAYDRTPGDGFHGDYDAYVIKFNSTGSAIVFGTYLGSQPGSANLDQAWAVALDTAGNVIVAGITTGDTFPTTPGAYDRTANVYIDNSTNPPQRILQDIFIARLNPTGTQLTYSTFFGGQGADYVYAMVVDSQNVVTITGKTAQLQSFDANGNEIPLGQPMPTTAGAFDTTYNGAGDAYIARFKLDSAGAADLKYASFLGGRQYVEAGDGIALNPANEQEVTVSGFTRSGDFPTTPGALLRTHFAPIDGSMAFVTRFNFASTANGSLVWSTFFGGPGSQSADAVVVDSTGAAIIAGAIGATNPPTTERAWDRVPVKYGAYDRTPQGVTNAYVARISADGSQLLYSTLLGGAMGEGISEMALVSGQTVVVAGTTRSVDFPVTAAAFDKIYGSDGRESEFFTYDVFVSRLTLQSNDAGDTTPPPAPVLLAPANASSFTAPREITLDWNDVSDPSGIEAYHVQVSPDPNFLETADMAGNFHENWPLLSYAVVDTSMSNGTLYWRVQALDRAHNMGPWSAVRSVSVQSSPPAPSPTPPLGYPVTVAVNPTSIIGGGTGQGTATLQSPAPAGGAVVELFSHDTTLATVPPSLTIPAGARSANFTVTGKTGIGRTGAVAIAGRYQGITHGQLVMVFADQPSNPLDSFALNPTTVTGGSAAQGTVALGQFWTAPPGGLVVTLASSNPQMAAVPASVTIPAGANSATFAVTTESTSVQTTATIFATRSKTISVTLTINPPGPPPPPAVYAMEVFPTTVNGGSTSQGTAWINPAAPAGGTVVTLSSGNTAIANVPASVTVPAGTQSANFNVTTSNVPSNTTVIISGTAGGATKNVTLGVNSSAQSTPPPPTPTSPPPTATPPPPTPTPPPPTATPPPPTPTPTATATPPSAATLSSLTLNPTSVNGGNTSQGTVTLNGAAPPGGAVIAISSNNSAATVPSSVNIPSGATSRSFTITTNTVNSTTTVTISAVYNGVTKTRTLTVNPRRGH